MSGPLLATKLHVPRRRANSVSREHLTQRLAEPARLALVAAPAGFGKTSVVVEWLSTLGPDTHVAWLSLDERDDETTVFWRYVLTALDRAAPGIAAEALELLTAGAAADEVVAALVNSLHASSVDIVLVLDDFHVIESTAVHSSVAYLVDHLPSNVRPVIVTRSDPALPLARMRAHRELTELRAVDLRFTPHEATTYLNEMMGLAVGADDVATLGERTEGWIAALQLAALSLQGRDDPTSFIAGFAGDDRYVVDYLVEEVLQRQTEAMRSFLLQTSLLGRLNGDLCDAVTATPGGAGRLDTLERANVFVVPLDDHREWFRYHHLFAEMLRARLHDEMPGRVRDLHLRASDWFNRNGHPADAIDHALAAEAFERAADLIKAAMPSMQQQRQEVALVRWLDALPRDVVRDHPELGIGYAGALLSAGRTDGVDRLLADAEAAAGSATDGILALRSAIALYRAARALTGGDLRAADEHSAAAVQLSASGSHISRGSSAGLRGLVLWASGDLERARISWAVSLAELEQAGHLSDMLGGSIALGEILTAQGRLADAHEVYRRALELGSRGDPPLRGTADMHVGMADLLRERGDLEGAHRHLSAAESLGEYAGLPQNRHRRRIVRARLLQAEGDPAAGIPLLDEAERLYTADFFPEVRPIAAMRARAQLAAGMADEARGWARSRRITADDELHYLAEFDHITLARLLLAEPAEPDDAGTAHRLLERLLLAAGGGGRNGVVIELLVLQALALQRQARGADALATLRRAVDLARPEGHVRVFADEGEGMTRMLAELAKRDGADAYLQRLQRAGRGGSTPPRPAQEILDPLSERELEVLRLLASDLSGPEISRHLFISLNTVRTHTKNIYVKLGVTSRRAAVHRAGELGLLRPPR
ncbi:LuxR C-terminal-related transcriptional regulator [Microbacterium flavescens]|uniref:LuxR C-terminal-related transcriptional regulator n=1 Tax=Microbacterium flavescens TaxID=69366 RepID=UPI001BDE06D0|nr:LuxR C-terminal-related transcriptional regulator [Microbacterium flavescens]